MVDSPAHQLTCSSAAPVSRIMSSPSTVLALLLLTALSESLADILRNNTFRRENGTFKNAPNETTLATSATTCALQCVGSESWFCGGFTYLEGGICHLFEGPQTDAVCVNPLTAKPPLLVEPGSERRSYRRLMKNCTGEIQERSRT